MIIRIEPVTGTTRQRVTYDDGRTLERQFLYLQPGQWEALIALARNKRISGSQMIGNLIDTAINRSKQK
jgi:hypothetical protein